MRLYLAVLVLCVGSLLAEKASLHGWLKFKKQHTKSYADSAEELARFKIWKSNLEFVEKHNKEADSGIHTYWVRMNKFGDLTSAEFGRLYNGFNASLRSTSPFSVPLKTHVYNAKMQVLARAGLRHRRQGPGSVRLVLVVLGHRLARGSELQEDGQARRAQRTELGRLLGFLRKRRLQRRSNGSGVPVRASQRWH